MAIRRLIRSVPWMTGFFILSVGLLTATGCNSSARKSKSGKQVIATFSIVADLVKNVAGDKVALKVLVGPGSDAHTYEPTPKDGAALAESDLIFENGVDFESWLDRIYKSSRSKARRVPVSEGLKLIALEEHSHGHTQDAKHDHKHEGPDHHHHGEYDPHTWHDVQNVMHMVGVIRDTLIKMDPANKTTYTTNAAAYLKQLEELDADIIQQVETLPKEHRKLVTTHDTFAYFARRYGFQVIGTALASASTETADPSAAHIAKLAEAVKAHKVKAIFTENVSNPRLMQRIADTAGVKVAPSLYTDALGEPGSDGDTYIKMMRHNVQVMVSLLKP